MPEDRSPGPVKPRGRPPGRTKKAITVSLPIDIEERLREVAKDTGLPVSSVVREALGLLFNSTFGLPGDYRTWPSEVKVRHQRAVMVGERIRGREAQP